jgi:medium-chain acyl-[acyl-carrier-protein] hydrolase
MSTTPWYARSNKHRNALLRLFCFPYAGGSAAIYRKWEALLAPRIEVIAVELPGRGARHGDAPFTALEPLVRALVPELSADLEQPFAIFGHSMGALIGYELAQALLVSCGKQPRRLFVSGRRAPGLPDPRKPTYDLPDREFMAELRRLQGTPADLLANAELMSLMLPMLRADFQLTETYTHRPGPLLNCPVSAFGGLMDADVDTDALSAWRAVSTGPFTLRMFEGDHFFIHSAAQSIVRMIELDLHPLSS